VINKPFGRGGHSLCWAAEPEKKCIYKKRLPDTPLSMNYMLKLKCLFLIAESLMLQPEEKLNLSDTGSKDFLIQGSQQAKL
jgi:hypothetical protein